VPANWKAKSFTKKEDFELDEYGNHTIFRGGRHGESKEEAESIPTEEISIFRIEGIWGNIFEPTGKIIETHQALQHSSVIADISAKFDVEETKLSIDGVGATKYRYLREEGGETITILIVVSSDDPRTLCGSFGFSITGITRLANEAVIHEVIDTIRLSKPKTQIFKSCDNPKQTYTEWVDSFLPDETPTPTVRKPLHTDNEVIDLVRNHMKYTYIPGDACRNLEYLAQQWRVTDLDSNGRYSVSATSAGIDLRWEVSMSSRDVRPTGNNQVQTYYDC
jgi:hypothetical protein